MNVLIDDNKKAVLCDFGLSRVKADVTSRTAILGTAVVAGSRNWMAPERLKGGKPKNPGDIYAFGMVIYEVRPPHFPSIKGGPNCFIDLHRRNTTRSYSIYGFSGPCCRGGRETRATRR